MSEPFEVGDAVQTPLGKGVVREVRNAGRLLVEVNGRALEVRERDVTPLEQGRRRSRSNEASGVVSTPASRSPRRAPAEIDLHGLTVEDALARVEDALNEALLADVSQLRFIHGRSDGRIRAALHKKLREIASVRHFLVDPRNEGVTIVEL